MCDCELLRKRSREGDSGRERESVCVLMEGMFGAKDRERQALVDGLRSEIETLNAKLSAQVCMRRYVCDGRQSVCMYVCVRARAEGTA